MDGGGNCLFKQMIDVKYMTYVNKWHLVLLHCADVKVEEDVVHLTFQIMAHSTTGCDTHNGRF